MLIGHGDTVLVVTRSAAAGEALCAQLQGAGMSPLLAGSGRDALRAAAQQAPVLLVCDAVLADMDVTRLLASMRELPQLDELPAIVVTSAAAPGVSESGESRFQRLLIRPVEEGELMSAAAGLLALAQRPRATRRGHVLVVDDNAAQRRLVALRLQDAGYEVTAAADGSAALELAARVRPDVVLSDVLMPGTDGFRLALELRAQEQLASVPVVLTSSAFVERPDEELAAQAGAVALVARSPDMTEVLAALEEALAASSRPEEDTSPQEMMRPGALERRYGERMATHLDRQLALNAQLRERLATQSVELAALAGLTVSVDDSAETELLGEVLARCAEVTGLGCCAVFVTTADDELELAGHVGFPRPEELGDFGGERPLLLGAMRLGDDRVLRLPDERLERVRSDRAMRSLGVEMLLIAPLRSGGERLGALVLGCERRTEGPDDTFVVALSTQLGHSLARVRAMHALARSQQRTVERLTRAAEFRDHETASHTQRVRRYCALLASLSGVGAQRAELIAAASMMHDIGKLGIPDSVLLKPGDLTAEQRAQMQRHAEYGHKILAGEPDPLLDLAAQIAWTHHERWDGQGYPRGLAGEQIPLEARIVSICDVFDALSSDRVYRQALTIEHAVSLMRSGRSTQFDPELLDLFLDSLPEVLAIRARHPDERSLPRVPSQKAPEHRRARAPRAGATARPAGQPVASRTSR